MADSVVYISISAGAADGCLLGMRFSKRRKRERPRVRLSHRRAFDRPPMSIPGEAAGWVARGQAAAGNDPSKPVDYDEAAAKRSWIYLGAFLVESLGR